jgi:hypothetical protein
MRYLTIESEYLIIVAAYSKKVFLQAQLSQAKYLLFLFIKLPFILKVVVDDIFILSLSHSLSLYSSFLLLLVLFFHIKSEKFSQVELVNVRHVLFLLRLSSLGLS